jgi:predicted regulator of Ras-like GTPase activity (Roadblock/LC7/MglB family)
MAQAADALAHLTEISSQIEAAVVLDREGTVLASTVEDDRAGRMAAAALELFRAADERSGRELVQLDAALEGGSVFVVRDEERLIAAATRAEPTVGLVFYDLKSALRGLAEPPEPPKPKRAPAKRRTTARAKKDDEGS